MRAGLVLLGNARAVRARGAHTARPLIPKPYPLTPEPASVSTVT